MANLYHNDRLIIAYASMNQSAKDWSPGAEITWKHDGERRSHSIGGLTDRFKSAEDAERFVLNFAKAWIDSHPCAATCCWLAIVLVFMRASPCTDKTEATALVNSHKIGKIAPSL